MSTLDSPVVFRNVARDHPVANAILTQSAHCKVLQQWERAALVFQGSYEDWLARNFSHQRRKEFKRLRARLAEHGEVGIRSIGEGEDLTDYVDNFLQLEKAGWKGARGTAIAGDANLAAALRNALAAMHASGRVRFWEITVAGRPIASLFALVDGSEISLGKTAYDERWARYSPGVLIILEATRLLFGEKKFVFADSNAIPGHPMIDRIWRDRVSCVDILAAGPEVSRRSFAALYGFMLARQRLRSLMKRALVSLTGRKVS